MRILWTLLKVIVGLAIAIPLGIVALGLTIGVVGVVLGLHCGGEVSPGNAVARQRWVSP